MVFLYNKRQFDTNGRSRVYNYYKCNSCSVEYSKQSRFEGAVQEHYCSAKCYHYENTRVSVKCAHCGVKFKKPASKLLNSKSGLYFCCREHKDLGQSYIKEIQPEHYGTINSYRAKALRMLGPKCSHCGYDNVDALEVHHKDRDRSNNDISNLQVFCANCHTLEHKGKL